MTFITSYNVRVWWRDLNPFKETWWVRRALAVRERIKQHRPIVICFQELVFPANLFAVPTGYCRITWGPSHVIYIRKEFAEWYRPTFRFRYCSACLARCGDTLVVNVHLHWNEEILRRNLEAIKKRVLDHDGPAVICGDFNAGRQEIDQIFGDTFHHIIQNKDTFQNWKTGKKGKIDHFYVKDFPEKVEATAGQLDKVSDHAMMMLQTSQITL